MSDRGQLCEFLQCFCRSRCSQLSTLPQLSNVDLRGMCTRCFLTTIMASKRKRNQTSAHLEIISTQFSPDASTSRMTTARNVTFTQQDTGRLGEQSDTTEIQISPEDLEVLQRHPEFSVAANSFLDFEHSVQDTLDSSNTDAATEDYVTPVKIRVRFTNIYLCVSDTASYLSLG